MYYLWLLNLNKNFKFDKKTTRLVYNFNFNRLKNKKNNNNSKKSIILKKIKKVQKLKLFNAFLFNYLVGQKYNILDFHKKKMYTLLMVLNSIINIISTIFYSFN